MNKVVKVSLIGLALVGLSACSSRHDTMGGNNPGTRAYGMHAYKGYRVNSRGYIQNPMRAPANQVYYFTFNGSQMSPKDIRALMIQARYLSVHPRAKVRLEGNADNRGSREYNVGLGWRRDQTVMRLMKQQGVRSSQIQMVSYGKERPAVMGNNEHAWALNRRVNFIYKVR